MNFVTKLSLASALALFIAAPALAQNATEGDYYVPGATTPMHATAGQMKRTQEGDYYVGDKPLLNHTRSAAIKMCTDGIPFDSDRYVACMSKAGQAP